MFPILENLRGFFSGRPPLVLFMICLASFAFALITFAYIVKGKDIPNPDVKRDWNTFLNNFSKLEMCLPLNTSDQETFTNSSGAKIPLADLTASDVYGSLHELLSKTIHLTSSSDTSKNGHSVQTSSKKSKTPVDMKLASSMPETVAPGLTSNQARNKYINLTIALNVDVYLKSLADAGAISESTQYIALIKTKQMFSQGFQEDDSELAATMTFPFNLTLGNCREHVDKICIHHTLTVCVNFQGRADLFPQTQAPSPTEQCSVKQKSFGDNSPIRMMRSTVLGQGHRPCDKGIQIRPSFSFDESLTVMLSLSDRSIINLHLMRTSYFLFVMVITFFCYAMIKGRPVKAKNNSNIPYVEKIPTHP